MPILGRLVALFGLAGVAACSGDPEDPRAKVLALFESSLSPQATLIVLGATGDRTSVKPEALWDALDFVPVLPDVRNSGARISSASVRVTPGGGSQRLDLQVRDAANRPWLEISQSTVASQSPASAQTVDRVDLRGRPGTVRRDQVTGAQTLDWEACGVHATAAIPPDSSLAMTDLIQLVGEAACE